jgi:hypothetical protein
LYTFKCELDTLKLENNDLKRNNEFYKTENDKLKIKLKTKTDGSVIPNKQGFQFPNMEEIEKV